jgi:hypothetical protein
MRLSDARDGLGEVERGGDLHVARIPRDHGHADAEALERRRVVGEADARLGRLPMCPREDANVEGLRGLGERQLVAIERSPAAPVGDLLHRVGHRDDRHDPRGRRTHRRHDDPEQLGRGEGACGVVDRDDRRAGVEGPQRDPNRGLPGSGATLEGTRGSPSMMAFNSAPRLFCGKGSSPVRHKKITTASDHKSER